ncbi:guanylate kinase [Aquisalimonas sp.]|uniref:guanylate kinase n=1 Tax=Aquisalimonas sp. TaxID=1872621 RepID=UPI0025C03537|nr:guanylate kinase [Aquisalimonas sp.]
MIGTLYIISAPSGAGKTSLVNALVGTVPGIALSISHTTRPQRANELDGEHYFFVDEATFSAMTDAGEFLEYAEVFGNRYGTAREPVERQLKEGIDVILEIDWQGAHQVRDAISEAVSVFVLPPSRWELERRLRSRGQDPEAVIARRMREAVNEISHHAEYQYLVVNDAFGHALDELVAVVRARRLRTEVQCERLAATLDDLLR